MCAKARGSGVTLFFSCLSVKKENWLMHESMLVHRDGAWESFVQVEHSGLAN